jgi:hypothetical protein
VGYDDSLDGFGVHGFAVSFVILKVIDRPSDYVSPRIRSARVFPCTGKVSNKPE